MRHHHLTRLLTTTMLVSSSAVMALAAGPPSAAQAATSCARADAFDARTLTAPTPEAGARFGLLTATGDFNRDGYTDAAVSSARASGGKVYIYHGSPTGLAHHQTLTSISPGGQAGDDVGTAPAVGDFNGDGFDDLAVGMPGQQSNAGQVRWWHGSANGLTTSTGSSVGALLTQESGGGSTEPGDRFGSALAAGDFTGDGKDDLAIGADEEAPAGTTVRSGEVTIMPGSSSGPTRGWIISQAGLGQTAKAGDEFGVSLTAGQVVGDGRDDLIIGARRKDLGTDVDTGAIFILNGASNKTTANPTFRGQGGNGDETSDQFGSSTAIGDFNKDGVADIAVGIPLESYTATTRRGLVLILPGPVTATSSGYHIYPTDTHSTATEDRFGSVVLAVDVDRDSFSDLLVSAVGTVRGGLANAGSVAIFNGNRSGVLRPERAIYQGDVGGIDGANDYFGGGPSVGDFDRDGRTDAIIGASGETRNGAANAGAAYVLDDLNPATGRAVEQFASTEGWQGPPVGTASAPIRYAYVDNVGGPRILTQTDPGSPGTTQRVADGPADAVLTGRPALGQGSDGKAMAAFRSTTGDLWMRTEVTAGTPAWGPWVNYGGPNLSGITLASTVGGQLSVFGVGARGTLSTLSQSSTGSFGAWQNAGIGSLTGDPITLATSDGIRIFATEADGNLLTALYSGSGLTGCSVIGDRTIVGRPAIVAYPGNRLRVFAATADQQLITIGQDTSGAFEQTWTTLRSSGIGGSPASIFDRNSGRITVMARGTDRYIWGATETAQGSVEFGTWDQMSATEAYTDVTAVPFTAAGGDSYYFVFRDVNNGERIILPADAPSAAARRAATPEFTEKVLPKS